jgi:sulfur carrier protein
VKTAIRFNGQPRDVPTGTTVAELLAQLELRPAYVAVEINLELVPRGQHAQCVLCEGDQVEVVTLVGGG